MNGKPLAYLDTASSAQKPRAVIDAMTRVMETGYANVHRGLYAISQKLTEDCENVRGKIARFIGASSPSEIIFTRNTTEAINLVAASWGRANLRAGDEIILSVMEHHANVVPWQMLEKSIGIVIKIIPMDESGHLDFGAFEKLLSAKTKFIGLIHISNALGTVNPVQKFIKAARAFNPAIKILIDGSQSVVHGAANVRDIDCDFFTFTGHKLYGPTGIGVLFGKYEILEDMPPYQGGGDMIERVSFKGTTFKPPPARFEAGTPAITEIIGLGAAIDYVSAIGMDKIAAHEQSLLKAATEKMLHIDGLKIHGAATDKAGIIAFTMHGAHPSDIAMILDKQGVAVRAGHHCAMPLMEAMGIDATVRASFGLYTNEDDINALVAGLEKARQMLA